MGSSQALLKRMPLPSAAAPERILGPRTGWVAAIGEDGTPQVDFEGNPSGHPMPALCGALVEEGALAQAARHRQGALLLFEEGDPARPVLVTLLRPKSRTEPQGRAVQKEVRVDGRRISLEAEDELELRCGEARLLLRRNGRVLLEGFRVDSRSRGLQRIKGGKVEIN